ncbi:MAG: VOC family protein [Taibaiella sp.]|nr:VOC family protein [Taibaiella sp.]
MQKITPFLWFDGRLEEAIGFYTSVFENSKVHSMNRMGEGGKIITATFELAGVEFMGLDGGPMFHFTEAVSFFVKCKDQQEVDDLWEKLLDGGEGSRCGWLKDKFGLSWQIIPDALGECLSNPDPAKAQKAMQAMMQMVKIDVAALKKAVE